MPPDKSNMAKYLFGGFQHCLYSVEKFQSDPERRLAVILERERPSGSSPRRASSKSSTNRGADHLSISRTLWPRPPTASTCWSRSRERTDDEQVKLKADCRGEVVRLGD